MASNSDQIQAEIARTRARMSAHLDNVGSGRTVSGGITDNIADQVRQRPLVAIGLSLFAGKLLQDYLRSSQGTSRGTMGSYSTTGAYPAQYGQSSVSQARDAISSGASNATSAATGIAHQAVETTRNVAGSVADTAGDVAGAVVDTAGSVARRVADTSSDAAEYVTENVGDLGSTITDQIRRRPLVAIGLSIAAGSLLNDYFSNGTARYAPSQSYGESYAYTSQTGYPAYAQTQVGSSVAGATRQAAGTAGDVASGVVDTTRDMAGTVAAKAGDAAESVVDTAGNVASTVADTATGVARQVVETTGDAAEYVSETVTDVFPTITREVRERPLTAAILAVGAGMLLQPTLQPYVARINRSVTTPVRDLGSGLAEMLELPEPDEADQIRQALVPAAVERAKQFTTHEMRDYLETNLENVVGQTSLRAGVVAAMSERAEGFVENRLPTFLENNLTGTRGLLALALTGAVLKARSQVQQGQGATISNIKTELSQSLTQSAREELERHFPAFREQYQSDGNTSRHCPNCGSAVAKNAHFCSGCGRELQ